jgi:benzylsuccinate CoA-transferase BbsF subunit
MNTQQPKLPMGGIRVLDFSLGGAGPFATKALADHGAEVIKVETSTHYDFPRTMAPYAGKQKGINRSAYFSNRNSSKLGVTLNLKTKEAVAIAKQLIPTCDIMVNNFRAGVLERAGLGYQEAAELRPDIIYVAMPLQGTGGPQANYGGVGHTLNVLAGIYGLIGYDDGTVVGPGTNFPDHSVNPGHALVAILAALIHRKKTGRGQYIEVSQLESTVNLLGPYILAYSLNRENPRPEGNSRAGAAPYGVFPCAAGEWVVMSVSSEAQWRALCEFAVDQPWAHDARFATLAQRKSGEPDLNRALSAWTQGFDARELMGALQGRGVPAGVVQTAKDLVERDPQIAARNHLVTLDHAEMGPTVYNNVPYRLEKTPGRLRHAAPLLGQHNDLVFREILGLAEDDYARMKGADVFK